MQNKRIEQTLPLIDIYIRSMHLVAPELSAAAVPAIEIKVKADVLLDII